MHARDTAALAAAVALAAVGVTVGPPAPATAAAPAPLFVATTGNDSNAGDQAHPLRTIQRAVDLAQPGTVISVRGGTYALTTNIQITRSGTASQPITLTRYGTERVVIDGEALPNTPAPVGGSVPRAQRGTVHMAASYWRLAGLELVNGPYGLYCDGCNGNVFERLSTHDNYESGLQIQGASSGNLVLDLDSYLNRDPRKNGESADGLAIKEGSGTGNVVRGARLWNNVDDGFDAWMFTSPITVEGSIAYGNGFNRWNFPNFAGDGNGFKMGGGDPDPAADHVIRNSMAFSNAAHGFTDNGNPGTLIFDHDTAYANPKTGFDVDSSTSRLTANLSVRNGTAVALGRSTGSGNSWNLSSVPAPASTDSSVITGPRTATGAIATSAFLRPANGADLGARI
ncbi:right-handed parallel beta-helix repeat-containing protein [Actinoplanes sp. NPDC048967]|uniref:right-handed parallel beta-helix repeat-containing protein n=1 Tax=Actinoplanes sp. NPDC048967 TaxID=3155269 RepID=UPI0033F37C2E